MKGKGHKLGLELELDGSSDLLSHSLDGGFDVFEVDVPQGHELASLGVEVDNGGGGFEKVLDVFGLHEGVDLSTLVGLLQDLGSAGGAQTNSRVHGDSAGLADQVVSGQVLFSFGGEYDLDGEVDSVSKGLKSRRG